MVHSHLKDTVVKKLPNSFIYFKVMRKAFQMFDTVKSGFIDTLKISTILNTMGQLFDDSELNELIEEVDPDGKLLFIILLIRI